MKAIFEHLPHFHMSYLSPVITIIAHNRLEGDKCYGIIGCLTLASFQHRMPLHHLIKGEDIDHLLERKLNVVTHLQIEEFVKLFTIIIANKPIGQVLEKFSMRSVSHDGWYKESSGQCEKERNRGWWKKWAISPSTMK